ncbi:Uma2 family endonuclease [Dolichospermum sp. UHCC 0259]|uniref:Uma2 family endonuclease n=1 Tax=Dolichospermum sp. UHCC 0259 TaxID=2590010 RepID=UPI001447698E|nr:Uma2 family endonuclease [Dolichospermum sp. UHCC 0259]MTJ47389.1 Uma2 family endonuclease [Dolichospermum sp. UHCC 0259]
MVQAFTKLLTFAEFILEYSNNPRYELADGELIDVEVTGPHAVVGGKLATKLGIAITHAELPWVIPRTCLIRPFAETATARRPDIVVLDETVLHHEPFWEHEPVIALGKSIKLVVEVVSTNWRDDYLTKLRDYEEIGILEYWIIDYLALGGIRYIGSPKQPTISIHLLIEGEYQVKQFQDDARIISSTFPDLNLTAQQVFKAGNI